MHAIISDQQHIPLPQDAARVRPSAGGDGRLARLAALDDGRRSEALTFLAGYAPGIFDARPPHAHGTVTVARRQVVSVKAESDRIDACARQRDQT